MDVKNSAKEVADPSKKIGQRRIDLHHHFFPSSLDKAKKNLQVGWRTPPENLPWTPQVSLNFMDALGIDKAILSLPPSPTGSINPENRNITKDYNALAASICKQYPTRFGFFASLPFLDDTEGDDDLLYLKMCSVK